MKNEAGRVDTRPPPDHDAGMDANDEVAPPTSHSPSDPTAPAVPVGDVALALAPPTPAAVLAWVATAGAEPWFPSSHAAATRTDRDALDDPLAQLRLAGLVQVAAWVRGRGQGYALTPAGAAAAAAGTIPQAAETVPVPTDPDPPLPAARLDLDPRPPLVVPVLLVANVLWFLVGVAAAVRGGHPVWRYLSEGSLPVLHRLGAVTGADLLAGEWWRLASSCFVHFGGLHLLANLFALAMMGPLAELLWGRKRLALIYAASGLGGACLAMALKPEALLAGASGAIWGVLASLLAWLLLFRSRLPADVAGDWARRLWVVLLLNAGLSFLPGISWQAHFGGGVAGFVTAGLLSAVRSAGGWRRLVAAGCLLALPVGCVGGLVLAMKRGEAWADLRHAAERRAAAVREAAWEGYKANAPLRLTLLNPGSVRAVEKQVGAVLLLTGERRARAAVPFRAWLAEAKAAADALAAPPEGTGSDDPPWPQVREYAAARARSLGLLQGMLDAPGAPDAAAWDAWGASRREADELWAGFGRP
jgi:membrane associated rhomboid family serine protease